MQFRPLHDREVVPPARPFGFPHELVDHPAFRLSEKRAILAEWASDRCAIESFPTLRLLPGTTFPVTFSSIMDARQQLDRLYGFEKTASAASGHVVPADFRKRKVFRGPDA